MCHIIATAVLLVWTQSGEIHHMGEPPLVRIDVSQGSPTDLATVSSGFETANRIDWCNKLGEFGDGSTRLDFIGVTGATETGLLAIGEPLLGLLKEASRPAPLEEAADLGRIQVLDLATGELAWSVEASEVPGSIDPLGRSWSVIGDVDSDGCDDVAIGYPELGRRWSGRVSVRSGKTGSKLYEFDGEEREPVGSAIGGFVGRCPDADGDGVDDVLAGSHKWAGDVCVELHSGKDGSLILRFDGPRHAYGLHLDGREDSGSRLILDTDWDGRLMRKVYRLPGFESLDPVPAHGHPLPRLSIGSLSSDQKIMLLLADLEREGPPRQGDMGETLRLVTLDGGEEWVVPAPFRLARAIQFVQVGDLSGDEWPELVVLWSDASGACQTLCVVYDTARRQVLLQLRSASEDLQIVRMCHAPNRRASDPDLYLALDGQTRVSIVSSLSLSEALRKVDETESGER